MIVPNVHLSKLPFLTHPFSPIMFQDIAGIHISVLAEPILIFNMNLTAVSSAQINLILGLLLALIKQDSLLPLFYSAIYSLKGRQGIMNAHGDFS
jgi:hypothetical protein